MSEQPKSLFRFHLLTAVVMMFAGGVVVGVNVRQWRPETLTLGGPVSYQGWPFAFFKASTPMPGVNADKFEPRLLAVDACIAFLIVCAVVFVFEFFIRRREARKLSELKKLREKVQ